MPEPRYLLDVNVLIALSEPEHVGHSVAVRWYQRIGETSFLLCPVTEAGFVRLTASPLVGGRSIKEALAMLRAMQNLPNCAHLALDQSWLELVAPFTARLHGYRQVTDALLLGLAIRTGSILVTLDRRIEALAGNEFSNHLLTLV